MIREADLIDDITADPDASGPRLVYADWLDERGRRDRAEWVRVQVGREALTEWDVRRVGLAIREDRIVSARARWELAWPSADGLRIEGWARGLPRTARLSDFGGLVEEQELVRRLGISHVRVPFPVAPDDVGALGPLPGVRALTLTGRVPEDLGPLDALLDSGLLAGLTSLDLEQTGMLAPAVHDRLERFLRRSALDEFGLERVRMREDRIETLLSSLPQTLHTLRFGVASPVGLVWEDDPWPYELLGLWPGLERIERLDLKAIRPGPAGLASVLDSPWAGSVAELGLNIAARALVFPAGASAVMRPRVLRIENCELSQNLGARLAAARCLEDLRVLRLEGVRISTPGVFDAMFGGAFRDTLQVVDDGRTAEGCGMLEGVLGGLAQGEPTGLHTVGFSGSTLVPEHADRSAFDKAVSALVRIPAAEGLRSLELVPPEGGGEMGAVALRRVLTRCVRLERLRTRTGLHPTHRIGRMAAARRLLASGGLAPEVLRPRREQ